MATITIEFEYSDGSDETKDFDVEFGLLDYITDYAQETVDAINDDLDDDEDEVELTGWKVSDTDLDYSGQRDHDDFDNLDQFADYCELVDEHGEAFVVRNNDWNGHEDIEGYEGCWRSEEEFVQHILEDCAGIPEIPSYLHIDWECTTRDVMMDYSSYEGDEGIHIFRD